MLMLQVTYKMWHYQNTGWNYWSWLVTNHCLICTYIMEVLLFLTPTRPVLSMESNQKHPISITAAKDSDSGKPSSTNTYIKHTKIGVWDFYEEKTPWSWSSLLLTSHLQEAYHEITSCLPYALQLSKDIWNIDGCAVNLFLYMFLKIACGMLPATNTWWDIIFVSRSLSTHLHHEGLMVNFYRQCVFSEFMISYIWVYSLLTCQLLPNIDGKSNRWSTHSRELYFDHVFWTDNIFCGTSSFQEMG